MNFIGFQDIVYYICFMDVMLDFEIVNTEAKKENELQITYPILSKKLRIIYMYSIHTKLFIIYVIMN